MLNRNIILISLLAACSMMLISCSSTKVYGIKVPNNKLSVKSDSCEPVLKWARPAWEGDITYDVIVYKSLRATIESPGEKVFYHEKIKDTFIKVSPPLKPKKHYLWSVRVRQKDGKVEDWSTYEHENAWGDYTYGRLFSLETGECEGVQSAKPGSDIKTQGKFETQSKLLDHQIVDRLNKGQALLVFRDIDVFHKRDGTIKVKLTPTLIRTKILVIPPGQDDEVMVHSYSGKLMLVGPPGTYQISRIAYVSGNFTASFRIMQNIVLQSKRILYIGDIETMRYSRSLTIFPHLKFDPNGFTQWFSAKYPQAAAFLVKEDQTKKWHDLSETQER